MKLLRFGERGLERPGALDENGVIRDLSAVTGDFQGASLSVDALARLRGVNLADLPQAPTGARIGAPLASIPNFHAVGLNYARHARESGMEPPPEPVLFSKATTALCGPYEDVIQPRDSTKLDWEVELGVVIGREASYVSEDEALDYVAGYCVINDVSERHFQLERAGQWVKGKSAPTFGPTGPYIVTADEIPDPQNLDLWLEVNGERKQDSNTGDMIFPVAHIISYMSRVMTLTPGDLIATGTPEGVGMGLNPQQWLQPGDEIRLGVSGLGEQRQRVIACA